MTKRQPASLSISARRRQYARLSVGVAILRAERDGRAANGRAISVSSVAGRTYENVAIDVSIAATARDNATAVGA